MCEILMQVAARTGGDFYKTCALPQAGDVIAIMEDGHPWGGQEMTNPDWRIFALPGVDASVFGNLLTGEVSTAKLLDNAKASDMPRTLQYRGFKLDLTQLVKNPAVQAVLAVRGAAIIRLPVAIVQPLLTAAVAKRAAIADPAAIG